MSTKITIIFKISYTESNGGTNMDVESQVCTATLIPKALPDDLCQEMDAACSMINRFLCDIGDMVGTHNLDRTKYPTLMGYRNLILSPSRSNSGYQLWQKYEIYEYFHRVRDVDFVGDRFNNEFAYFVSDFFKIALLRNELVDLSRRHNYHPNWLLSDSEWEFFAVQWLKSIIGKTIALRPQCHITISGISHKINNICLIFYGKDALQPITINNITILVRLNLQNSRDNKIFNLNTNYNQACLLKNLSDDLSYKC